MGNRLVVSIYATGNDEDPLATVYYHWSADTLSSLNELDRLNTCMNGTRDPDEAIRRIAKGLHEHGGGYTKNAANSPQIRELYTDPQIAQGLLAEDRTNGLIDITEQGMKESLEWADGDAAIILDEAMAWTNCLEWPDSPEAFRDDYGIGEDELAVVDTTVDFDRFPVSQAGHIAMILQREQETHGDMFLLHYDGGYAALR